MRIVHIGMGLVFLATATSAQAPSPYAGEVGRGIKALAPERAAGLLAGAGLGYAKAAELNGHAGPRHVLELTAELGLSAEQRTAVEASFERMKAAAIEAGTDLLAVEAELDRRFAHRHLDESKLAELTARIGELEGRLRLVHLRAHLETDAILEPEQRQHYSELRGYGVSGASGHEGHEGHQD